VCNADGSNLLKLTSFGGPLTGTPRWSPDGQRIVLDSRASGRPELYIVGADGGTPTLLRTTPAGGSVPYWSHDGRWIYFSTDVEGDSQIFKIAVEGGTPVQLTHQGGFVARESADGTRLYYTKMHSKAEFWSVGTDGSGEARVEDLPEFAVPAWDLTRDGIYFYDAMPRNRDILYYDFATRRTRRALQTAAPFAPFVVNLSVSPDGKDILYTQLGRSTADILLVDGFR
jgi:Tol biopolymer transport system component